RGEEGANVPLDRNHFPIRCGDERLQRMTEILARRRPRGGAAPRTARPGNCAKESVLSLLHGAARSSCRTPLRRRRNTLPGGAGNEGEPRAALPESGRGVSAGGTHG